MQHGLGETQSMQLSLTLGMELVFVAPSNSGSSLPTTSLPTSSDSMSQSKLSSSSLLTNIK